MEVGRVRGGGEGEGRWKWGGEGDVDGGGEGEGGREEGGGVHMQCVGQVLGSYLVLLPDLCDSITSGYAPMLH